MKIIIPDGIHIKEKNFKSLFDFIKEKKITKIIVTKHDDIKSLYGNYNEKIIKDIDEDLYLKLNDLSKEELFNYSNKDINLFEISKTEILSYVITLENWYSLPINNDSIEIYDKLWKENKDILIKNIVISNFWIDFWFNCIKLNKGITHSISFSGSLIYIKSLTKILINTNIKSFLVEHFLTGLDYYFEEKHDYISNNSDIKLNNYYNSIELPSKKTIEFEKEKKKSINKFLMRNNKNVKQPEIDTGLKLEKNTILILGQVINDFSILEQQNKIINISYFYINLIEQILKNTDFNIIFKAHPWENHKINLKKALTKEIIMNFINKKSKNEQKRIQIVENSNLDYLIENSEYIVSYCSQSLIECAFKGKKTIQFGDAFYGKKGFTYDYKYNEIDIFVKDLNNSKIRKILNKKEWDMFEIFLIKIFQFTLISWHNSGKKSLESKFKIPDVINLYVKKAPIKKTIIEKTIEKEIIVKKRNYFKLIKKMITKPKQFIKDSKMMKK